MNKEENTEKSVSGKSSFYVYDDTDAREENLF